MQLSGRRCGRGADDVRAGSLGDVHHVVEARRTRPDVERAVQTDGDGVDDWRLDDESLRAD